MWVNEQTKNAKIRRAEDHRPRAGLGSAIAALPGTLRTVALRNWNVAGNGTWNTDSGWSPNGVPGAGANVGDAATITNADGTSRNVTLNVSVGLNSLDLGNTGAGTNTLTQSGPHQPHRQIEKLGTGNSGKASHTQSAGNNTFSGYLSVGYGLNSNATYDLSGGSVAVKGASTVAMYVGFDGTGNVNEGNASVTVGDAANAVPLYLGYDGNGFGAGNGNGHYTLSDYGSLAVNGAEYIGFHGVGHFTQTGGTHSTGLVGPAQPLYLGYISGSSGTYTLSGGTLSVGLPRWRWAGNWQAAAGRAW